jgi:SSS family solute:Na+ symporter
LNAAVPDNLQTTLAITLVLYLLVMYAIGWFAQSRVHDTADYLVAGRRLPLSLAWLTILATWFGAGTLLTAADEVYDSGLQATALDPLGAGFCLLIAGWFVAGPIWRMQLLTVPDLFCQRYGRSAELLAAVILVPSYFGWIAVQFTALAGILQLFFGIDPNIGILLVAVVGTGYTLMGGMWSVTLTDAVQMTLVLGGLVLLTVTVLQEIGSGEVISGLERLLTETPETQKVLIPAADLQTFMGWFGLFVTGALGNIPAQDLMQRVFSSRSEQVARRACLIAGGMYLLCGAMPPLLALSAHLLLPDTVSQAVLPALAARLLSPAMSVIFLLAVLSAILSTIDSAILSPAGVLAQNVFPRFTATPALKLNRISVLLVAGFSLMVAYAGEDAWSLLEEAYLMTLAGLFVPVMFGIHTIPRSQVPGIASMLAGIVSWIVHPLCGWEEFLLGLPFFSSLHCPVAIGTTLCSLLAYLIAEPPWTIQRCSAETMSAADLQNVVPHR